VKRGQGLEASETCLVISGEDIIFIYQETVEEESAEVVCGKGMDSGEKRGNES
jgi:hypothetical protein